MNPLKSKLKTLLMCVLLMSLLLTVFAQAADTDYTGYLDPETGEPVNEVDNDQGLVELTESMYYDWNSHDYAYTVNGGEVHASVADGMIVSEAVKVYTNSADQLVIYKDGEIYEGSADYISEVGSYVVQSGGESSRSSVLTFSIVGKTTNTISTFTVPDDFYIVEASRNGEPIYAERYSVSMLEEGDYVVQYENMSTDLLYTLSVTIDRTPPQITLEGKIDDDGRYHSAVKLTGFEEGDSVRLTSQTEDAQNLIEILADGTTQISEPGNYELTVYDAAGNAAEYPISILVYFNRNTLIFLGLVAAVAIGILVYVFLKRERLKIG